MGWAQRQKERARVEKTGYVATITITVRKVVALPNGQQVVRDVESREASAEASSPREAAEAAFADGFERFIAGLPEQSRVVLPMAVPAGTSIIEGSRE